jgi:hypothetical protein
MGVYFDHGVEYRIKFTNNSYHIIANTKATDERLVITQYYNDRKSEWFQINNSLCQFISKELPDMYLSEEEKSKLDNIFQDKKDDIIEYGWYDIIYMSDSYENYS